MKLLVGGLAVVVVALAFIFEPIEINVLPNHLGPLRTEGDGVATTDVMPFGRFQAPFRVLTFGDDSWKLKRWSFVSFTTDHYFVGFAVAHLSFLSNTFLYVVDTRTHTKVLEYSVISPFPIPQLRSFAPSSVSGCTEWQSGFVESLLGDSLHLRVCGDPTSMKVILEFKNRDHSLSIDATSTFGEALALLYPISGSRPAYTHKEAAMPTTGTITVDGEKEIPHVASIDWTYALSRRVTIWKWCSLQGTLSDGTSIGLNLSDEVYNDNNGRSQENAAWLNNKVIDFPEDMKVTWEMGTNKWSIYSPNHPTLLNLTFTPRGTREEHVHVGIIASDFVQPFGTFEGVVAEKQISNLYGVVENHYAKW